MPQEIITWYLLPAIRRDIAKNMIKNGMSQRQVARRLGMTDAAISQYINGKRAYDVKLEPSVKRMISNSAKRIMKSSDVIGEVNSICDFCRDKLVLCRLHKSHGAPRKCDICFKVARK